jgi:hypothetical protein
MSPKETVIAEAAIKAYPSSDYIQLHAQIATATGYSVEEVEEIIGDLTADFTLRDCATAAINRAEDADSPKRIAKAWYEKGELWGSPRMTLRS